MRENERRMRREKIKGRRIREMKGILGEERKEEKKKKKSNRWVKRKRNRRYGGLKEGEERREISEWSE